MGLRGQGGRAGLVSPAFRPGAHGKVLAGERTGRVARALSGLTRRIDGCDANPDGIFTTSQAEGIAYATGISIPFRRFASRLPRSNQKLL